MFRYKSNKNTKNEASEKQLYDVCGENNKIIVLENGVERDITYSEKVPGIEIILHGDNNQIFLELPIQGDGSTIIVQNNNATVQIGTTFLFENVRILCNDGNNQKVEIGAGTTMHDVGILATEDAEIRIGSGCMFSARVYIYGSDGHAMYDIDTGECINGRRHPTIIGESSWISSDAIILKNAVIPPNSVVAAASVVTRNFEKEGGNICLAGNPATVIKRRIDWSYESPSIRMGRLTEEKKQLRLSSDKLEWSIGQVGRLRAYVNECKVPNKVVTWTSEDKKVCDINVEGELCMLSEGVTRVIASYQGEKAVCEIIVQ